MKVFLLELSMVLAAFTLAAPLAVMAAAEDEDQTLAMHEGTDENQVNSLDFNDEYARQLYQKVSLQNEKKTFFYKYCHFSLIIWMTQESSRSF